MISSNSKKIGIAAIFSLLTTLSIAQVGIGTITPAESSILDIESAEGGILIPRVDIANLSTQDPVTTATIEESLLVYNTNITTGKGFYYWNGSEWTPLLDDSFENLYTSNGTLSNNRIVTQNTNSLTFNSSGTRNGLTLQKTNDANENGLTFQSSTGLYQASIYNEAGSAGGLRLATRGSDASIANVMPTMTLQNDGDVGINTTNPFFKFHINVDDEIYDGIFFEKTGANAFTSEITMYRVDGANHLYLENNDPNGRIGFGISGLTEYFMSSTELSPTASGTSDLGSLAYNWDSFYGNTVYTSVLNGNDVTGRLDFQFNSTSEIFMTDSELSPTASGTFDLGSLTNKWGDMYGNTVYTSVLNGNDVTGRLDLNFNSTSEIFMTSSEFSPSVSGGSSLGSNANRWRRIWLQQAPNVSSDRRLKYDIKELNYGLAGIMRLNSYRYLLKDDETKEPKIGFIAQELKEVFPELVKGEETDGQFLSVTYTEMIPILLNAIKEQQQIIDSQKSDIESQKELTANILKRLDQLERISSN